MSRMKRWFPLTILILLVMAAIIGPIVYNNSPTAIHLESILVAPSKTFPLGSDELGRDVLARLLSAMRISLTVGITVGVCQTLLGLLVGMICGYKGGVLDAVLTRILDFFLIFPFFVLAITIASLTKPGLLSMIVLLTMLGWTSTAKLIRGEVMRLKKMEFIDAAKVVGASEFRIMWKHIFPHLKPYILVNITIGTGGAILSESSLSFLGVGIVPPTASLGNMLTYAQNLSALKYEPWVWAPPGLVIVLTVTGINLLTRHHHNARA